LRRFGNDELRGMLPARASAAGVDFAIRSPGETHSLVTHFAVSEVTGESDVIQRLQRSSARYFDRPDREPGGNGVFSDAWDANARSLRGFAGYARATKEAGTFQWEAATNIRSPGFEVNDLAFLTRSDFVWMNANVMANFTDPTP